MVSQIKMEKIIGLLEELQNGSPRATQDETDDMRSAKSDLIRIWRS